MNNLNEPSQTTDEPVLILRVAYWFLFLCLVFAGFGAYALYYAFEKFPAIHYELLAYGIGITVFIALVTYYIMGRRVVMYADRLVSTSRFSTQSTTLDEIAETEFTPDFFRVVLESKSVIKVPWYLKNALRLRKQLNTMIEERGELGNTDEKN